MSQPARKDFKRRLTAWVKLDNKKEAKEPQKKTKLKAKLKKIQANMGNLASSIPGLRQNNHYIDAKSDYALRLMTSLNQLRNQGIDTDMEFGESTCRPAHRIVVSYNDYLMKMASCPSNELMIKLDEQVELTTKDGEAGNDNENDSNSCCSPEAEVNIDEVENMKNENKEQNYEGQESKDTLTQFSGEQTESKVIDQFETSASIDPQNDIKTCFHPAREENTKEDTGSGEDNSDDSQDLSKIDLTCREDTAEQLRDETHAQIRDTENLIPIATANNVNTDHKEDKDTTYKGNPVNGDLLTEEATQDVEDSSSGVNQTTEHCCIVTTGTSNGEDLVNNHPSRYEDDTAIPTNIDKGLAKNVECTAYAEQDMNQTAGNEMVAKHDLIINEKESVPRDALESLITYLYTASVAINKVNCAELRSLASLCGMTEVVAACDEFYNGILTPKSGKNGEESNVVDSEYHFTNPDLHEQMLQHFNKLRNEKKYFDCAVVNLATATEKTDAHRVMLSAASAGLCAVLHKEGENKQVDPCLENIDKRIFDDFIGFLYTGSVRVIPQTVVFLFETAHHYDVTEIAAGCSEFLESTLAVANCLQYREIAEKFQAVKLLEATNHWIASHFHEIAKASELLKVSSHVLKSIMSFQALNLRFPLSDGEMEVFETIVKWIEHSTEQREKEAAEVLASVRFSLIGLKRLVDHVSTNLKVMSHDKLCARITDTMAAKSSDAFIIDGEVDMRGVPCVVTVGGSAIVEDETSEGQDYAAVGYTNKVTMYSNAKRKFHELTVLPESRSLHCVVACEQFIFVIGGYDSFSCITNSVLCLDLADAKWRACPSMKIRRACFTAHAIGKHIYVVGGLTPNGYTASVERFDRDSGRWENRQALSVTRYRHAGCVQKSCIVISGGHERERSVYSYDTTKHGVDNGKWDQMTAMKHGRDSHVMAAVGENLFCIGGDTAEFTAEFFHRGVWSDIDTKSMTIKKLYFPSVAVLDDQVFLLGGWVDENEATNEIWCLNTTEMEWTRKSEQMPLEHGSSASCLVHLPESYWKARFISPCLQDIPSLK